MSNVRWRRTDLGDYQATVSGVDLRVWKRGEWTGTRLRTRWYASVAGKTITQPDSVVPTWFRLASEAKVEAMAQARGSER